MGYFIKKYAKDDLLPNLARIIEEGTSFKSVPCAPVDTPTNWATLMSGASPSVHGVISFTTHMPGEEATYGQSVRRTQHSSFSKAEFLWTTLERSGFRPAVVNYPVGWPPQIRNGFVVGGLTPGGDVWRVSKPKIFSTAPPIPLSNDIKGVQPSYSPLIVHKEGENLWFDVRMDYLDVVLSFRGTHKDGKIDHVRMAIEGVQEEIRLDKDGWSPWITVPSSEGGTVFKVKVYTWGLRPEVGLYITQGFKTKGWAYPAGLDDHISGTAGPYVEGLDTPFVSDDPKRPYGPSNLDAELVLEHAEMHAGWFPRVASQLCGEGEADAFVLHYHLIDSINHTYLGLLSKEHPAFDEGVAAKVEGIYQKAYRVVDRMVGELMKVAGDATIVLTSDHAALPTWKYVSVEAALVRAGLMKYERMGNGTSKVDIAQSQVFPYHDPLHIWINLKGREPKGIVNQGDYDSVVDSTIDALYSIRDPDKGNRVVKLAVRKDRARPNGKASERMGDIWFFLEPGYSNWNGTIGSLRFDEVEDSRLEHEVVSGYDVAGHHTTFLPTETMGDFTNNSFTVMRGRGIRKGAVARASPRLMDVAPTVAHMMDVEAPRDSEGEIIYDIFE